MKVYLAINYGSNSWILHEKENFQDALESIKGEPRGDEWKILYEPDVLPVLVSNKQLRDEVLK